MADFAVFRLRNFKGVQSVEIKIPRSNNGAVVTLIGLNESGKTTILEGISQFGTENKALSSVFDRVYSNEKASYFMPIAQKAAFDGDIEIEAVVEFVEEDFRDASEIAKRHGVNIDLTKTNRTVSISRKFQFKNSILTSARSFWGISFTTHKEGEDQPKIVSGPKSTSNDLWLDIVSCLEKAIPSIAYFPTFLVEIPNRIYLAPYDGESALNIYYREVIQDVLQCLSPKLSLDQHVINRITSYQRANNSSNWVTSFSSTSSKGTVDAVFQKLASSLTKEVLGSWSKVFNRPSGAKAIHVDWNIDTEKANLPYLTFSVSDGESRYQISERSLGFRWFFSFLLFTRFKQTSIQKTLFLFDEPAANLHAKAQAELLKNFSRIASNGNKVVYSTHSHHMINPQWLNSSYIIENTAIDYDQQNDFDLDLMPTNVTAKVYRRFVAQHPHRVTYFQPVIEKLQYITPGIVGHGPFLILEGISDYNAMRFAASHTPSLLKGFSLMPGTLSRRVVPLDEGNIDPT